MLFFGCHCPHHACYQLNKHEYLSQHASPASLVMKRREKDEMKEKRKLGLPLNIKLVFLTSIISNATLVNLFQYLNFVSLALGRNEGKEKKEKRKQSS